jgi:hypothetical protein
MAEVEETLTGVIGSRGMYKYNVRHHTQCTKYDTQHFLRRTGSLQQHRVTSTLTGRQRFRTTSSFHRDLEIFWDPSTDPSTPRSTPHRHHVVAASL